MFPRKKRKRKKRRSNIRCERRTEADGQYVNIRKFRSSTVSRFENLVRKVIIKKLPAPIMPSKAKDGVKWVPDGWANACMRYAPTHRVPPSYPHPPTPTPTPPSIQKSFSSFFFPSLFFTRLPCRTHAHTHARMGIYRCTKKFGLALRKHHCRKCGFVICKNCSTLSGKERMCSMCYQAVAAAMIGLPGSESSDPMTAEVRLGMHVVQIHTFAPFFFSSF